MNDDRLAGVRHFYDGLLAANLDDARTVGWRSSQTQRRNFAALSDVFAHEPGSFSVYDVGCGLAGFSAYLKAVRPAASYAGCDIHPGMVDRAKRKYPRLPIEERNILGNPPERQYDYVVASGTFSHASVSTKIWADYVREMVAAMFRIASRGVGVIFLSTFADIREPGDYHQDPAAILDFVQRELSPLAEVRHAFSPWTFALFVYKNPAGTGLT